MDLVLALKGEYFKAIKSGQKIDEYRLCNAYWQRRLEGRSFARIVLTLGYPLRDDETRRLVRPWLGYKVQTIVHPHFGVSPVLVYAITVNGGGPASSPTDGSKSPLSRARDEHTIDMGEQHD